MFFKIFNYCFQNLKKLVMCSFLTNDAGGGISVRDEGRGRRGIDGGVMETG